MPRRPRNASLWFWASWPAARKLKAGSMWSGQTLEHQWNPAGLQQNPKIGARLAPTRVAAHTKHAAIGAVYGLTSLLANWSCSTFAVKVKQAYVMVHRHCSPALLHTIPVQSSSCCRQYKDAAYNTKMLHATMMQQGCIDECSTK